MLISEYIGRKQLLLEAVGVTTILVPEEQIDDTVKQVPLTMYGDITICPYCMVYKRFSCSKCSMGKANNTCNIDENSTYSEVLDELKAFKSNITIIDVPGMVELVNQYNKELEDEDTK